MEIMESFCRVAVRGLSYSHLPGVPADKILKQNSVVVCVALYVARYLLIYGNIIAGYNAKPLTIGRYTVTETRLLFPPIQGCHSLGYSAIGQIDAEWWLIGESFRNYADLDTPKVWLKSPIGLGFNFPSLWLRSSIRLGRLRLTSQEKCALKDYKK